MSIKRFLLFGFDEYYPEGGWRDFVSDHDTLEDAKAAIQIKRDRYQVVDLETKEEVFFIDYRELNERSTNNGY